MANASSDLRPRNSLILSAAVGLSAGADGAGTDTALVGLVQKKEVARTSFPLQYWNPVLFGVRAQCSS